MIEKQSLTCRIAGMDNGVFVLDILDHTSNQSLGAVWGCIDSNQCEGARRLLLSHDELQVLDKG